MASFNPDGLSTINSELSTPFATGLHLGQVTKRRRRSEPVESLLPMMWGQMPRPSTLGVDPRMIFLPVMPLVRSTAAVSVPAWSPMTSL